MICANNNNLYFYFVGHKNRRKNGCETLLVAVTTTARHFPNHNHKNVRHDAIKSCLRRPGLNVN